MLATLKVYAGMPIDLIFGDVVPDQTRIYCQRQRQEKHLLLIGRVTYIKLP